ncbi:MAG: hypothetical protein NUW22_13105 [Acidobacteria bacterium]|nr:hypothetical protein [Acidobacteriota bacterium]
MADSWTEMWSIGGGRARTYCGIAEAEGEFAVDLFSGDTCLSSEVFATRPEAARTAQALHRRYLAPLRLSYPDVGISASA